MNELEIKSVTERFFKESLKSFENEKKNENSVLILLSYLLEEKENKEDAYRNIHGMIDSDMEFSAYSKKLSNLLQLKDSSVWMKILSKAAPVVGGVVAGEDAFGLSEKIKLAGGILAFLAVVSNEGVFVKFSKQDAKILFAISQIGTTFSKDKLLTEMKSLNIEYPDKFDIPVNLIERSIKKFVKHRVLKGDTRDDIFAVIENIKFDE